MLWLPNDCTIFTWTKSVVFWSVAVFHVLSHKQLSSVTFLQFCFFHLQPAYWAFISRWEGCASDVLRSKYINERILGTCEINFKAISNLFLFHSSDKVKSCEVAKNDFLSSYTINYFFGPNFSWRISGSSWVWNFHNPRHFLSIYFLSKASLAQPSQHHIKSSVLSISADLAAHKSQTIKQSVSKQHLTVAYDLRHKKSITRPDTKLSVRVKIVLTFGNQAIIKISNISRL